MSRSERIAQQLGMSHGEAAGKLRKKILFSLLVRLKENVCFKCGSAVETDDDLSIEHKQPWENRETSLFWDLENIAFSHTKCNVPHIRRGGEPKRIIGEQGLSWCTSCKRFHPESDFSKDAARWNGLRKSCRQQMKLYKERYFESKPYSSSGRTAVS